VSFAPCRQWTVSHVELDPSEVRTNETFIVRRTTTRLFVTARSRLGASIHSPFPPRRELEPNTNSLHRLAS
jgi:hypothetical protein